MATTNQRGRVIPVQPAQQQQQQQSGLLKSSLDIVWSYSRSQAFFGSNLPSSPSFVQRYHPHLGRFSSDDNLSPGRRSSHSHSDRASDRRRRRRGAGGVDGVVVGSSSAPEASAGREGGEHLLATTTEEESDEDDDDDDDDDYSGSEDVSTSSSSAEDLAAAAPPGQAQRWPRQLVNQRSEQLPWNAVPQSSSSGSRKGGDTVDTASNAKTATSILPSVLGTHGQEPPEEDEEAAITEAQQQLDHRKRRRRSSARKKNRSAIARMAAADGLRSLTPAAASTATLVKRAGDATNDKGQGNDSQGHPDAQDHVSYVTSATTSTTDEGGISTNSSLPESSDARYHDDDARPFSSTGGARPVTMNERTPLLEKTMPRPDSYLRPPGSHLDGRDGDVDEAIYSSSPPESVPFPRRSSHVRKRRLSDKKRQRRKKPVVHQGSSTSGQTLFNAINVLVGIGILAQPLAFSQAGWVLGVGLLIFYGLLTNYTAKILARVLFEDHRVMTYADIGAKAFGNTARNFINGLFCLEISALCVALIILLGDSLATIFPLKAAYFKLIGFGVLFPTLFLPLRYLSIASIIGILSVVTLTITVLIDGTIAQSQPGSLRHPMPTSVGPSWKELPIAFGLIMSGFGGHAVIPSLARDMKKPKDFNWVCNTAFAVATGFYLLMGVVGYLMFGHHVTDEITRDLLNTPGLPRKLNLVSVCMVAITPVCKYAISSTPLEGTISYLLGVEQAGPRRSSGSGSGFSKSGSELSRSSSFYSYVSSGADDDEEDLDTGTGTPTGPHNLSQAGSSSVFSSLIQPMKDTKPRTKKYTRLLVKTVTSFLLLAIAIFIPSFDRIMGLLGAFSVFLICAIGPLAANLSLHRQTMSYAHIGVDVVLIAVSVVMAVLGTVFVFLPKRTPI